MGGWVGEGGRGGLCVRVCVWACALFLCVSKCVRVNSSVLCVCICVMRAVYEVHLGGPVCVRVCVRVY